MHCFIIFVINMDLDKILKVKRLRLKNYALIYSLEFIL